MAISTNETTDNGHPINNSTWPINHNWKTLDANKRHFRKYSNSNGDFGSFTRNSEKTMLRHTICMKPYNIQHVLITGRTKRTKGKYYNIGLCHESETAIHISVEFPWTNQKISGIFLYIFFSIRLVFTSMPHPTVFAGKGKNAQNERPHACNGNTWNGAYNMYTL